MDKIFLCLVFFIESGSSFLEKLIVDFLIWGLLEIYLACWHDFEDEKYSSKSWIFYPLTTIPNVLVL